MLETDRPTTSLQPRNVLNVNSCLPTFRMLKKRNQIEFETSQRKNDSDGTENEEK